MTYSALKSELRNRVVAILSENELASIGEYIPVELVCMVNTKEPDTVTRQTQIVYKTANGQMAYFGQPLVKNYQEPEVERPKDDVLFEQLNQLIDAGLIDRWELKGLEETGIYKLGLIRLTKSGQYINLDGTIAEGAGVISLWESAKGEIIQINRVD
jgi:hypothetical protein